MVKLDVTFVPLKDNQYFRETSPKNQIYLHHTASSYDPYSVLNWWASAPERIATAFIVGGKPPSRTSRWIDGEIVQAFSSRHWAYHLGLRSADLRRGGAQAKSSLELHKKSIGIEICAFGQLTKTSRGFTNYLGRVVPDNEVVELPKPHRGFTYYHAYTDAQIESTRKIIVYLGETYDIPMKYLGDVIFDLYPPSVQGVSGVFTHNSCRDTKVDVAPQPKLIEMLKSL